MIIAYVAQFPCQQSCTSMWSGPGVVVDVLPVLAAPLLSSYGRHGRGEGQGKKTRSYDQAKKLIPGFLDTSEKLILMEPSVCEQELTSGIEMGETEKLG